MHFWIDKPAGRYYGFSGRRYPAMSFPKTHFTGNHRRCGNALDAHRLHMVTPVHRFQTGSSSANSAGPSASNSSRSSRQNPQNNSNRNSSNNSGVPPGQENSNSNANNSNNNQQALPQSTSATNRGLLNLSEFSDANMATYRLRCSVWILFIMATGIVAVARLTFDHQFAGVETLMFCGLFATVLMSGCFYTVTCRRVHNNHRQEVQAEPIATVTVANPNSNESNRQVSMPIRQNPPPPYHIAILIPPPISPEEAPPPAYDKIMQ